MLKRKHTLKFVPCLNNNLLGRIANFHTSKICCAEKPKPEYRFQPSDKVINSYLGQPSPSTHAHKLSPGQVSIGLSKDELSERRHKLMFNLRQFAEMNGSNKSFRNLVVLPAATTLFNGPDVPYPFRQESNFFYLTGYQEADSILVLHDDGKDTAVKSALFVSPKDPHKELWEGPRAGVEGALYLTGVNATGFIDDAKGFLDNFTQKFDRNNLRIYYDPPACGINTSQLARNLFRPNITDDFVVSSPYNFVHELRWKKSVAEIALLRKSCDIAAKAFENTMRFSYPNVDENHLVGKFDFECRINGASSMAYPPVVAGGDRANTIHYLNADQLIQGNELVLMDAGCDYGGYASDITRCWPVSGQFTSAQKELYEVLLKVQTDLLTFLGETRPVSLRDLFIKMLDLLGDGLSKLGLFDGQSAEARRGLADLYCPHHVSHYLGLDVHDTESISRSRPLEPGVVVTIEPGVYFKQNDASVPKQFRGIGLRIEDDVLITDSGIEILSKNCPKDVNEIQRIMKSKM